MENGEDVLEGPDFQSPRPFGPIVNLLITIRGFVLLLVLGYLVWWPALGEKDIVASVISYLLLLFLVLFLFTSLFWGRWLKKKLTITLALPNADDESEINRIVSGKPVSVSVRLGNLALPPLFSVEASIDFASEDLPLQIVRATGSRSGDRLTFQNITFPHRGNWSVAEIRIRFGDQFGFTAFRWRIDPKLSHYSIPVHPPKREIGALPILSSCQRVGDTLIDIHQRHGDPFDIKRYHPSDGMKKILWKIYAKRGELLSRHPEPSMTPEGQVVVFLIADKEDDHAASTALSYLRQLEEMNLEILFGCEGMGGSESVTTSRDAEELMIDSVWATHYSTPASVHNELDHFLRDAGRRLNDARLTYVLIFASAERAATQSGFSTLSGISDYLEVSSMKPIFFIVPGERAYRSEIAPASEPKAIRLLRSWLLLPSDEGDVQDLSLYKRFLHLSLLHQREVIVTERTA